MTGHSPVKISFRMFGNIFRSTIEVTAPSSVPNCESIPSVNSIMKKSIDQKGANGNLLIASVNTINARPVPDAPCFFVWSKVN